MENNVVSAYLQEEKSKKIEFPQARIDSDNEWITQEWRINKLRKIIKNI